MSAISGSLRKLAIRRGGSSGTWEDVAHVVSDSWNTTTSFLNTTTRENKGFETSLPVNHSSTISVSAIIFQDSDLTGKIGYKTLKEVQQARERVEYRLQILGENYLYYGLCYIESVGDTADVSNVLVYDISFRTFGNPVELGDNTAPTAPTLFLLTDGNQQISLQWNGANDDVGVVGYELRKARNSNPFNTFDVGNVLTYTDNAVSQGSFYSYNVRAYDAVGNRSEWSNKVAANILLPSEVENQTTAFLYQDGEEAMFSNGQLIIYQD